MIFFIIILEIRQKSHVNVLMHPCVALPACLEYLCDGWFCCGGTGTLYTKVGNNTYLILPNKGY